MILPCTTRMSNQCILVLRNLVPYMVGKHLMIVLQSFSLVIIISLGTHSRGETLYRTVMIRPTFSESLRCFMFQFQKTESDLNYLSQKLECEFENSHQVPEGSNPVTMLKRLAEIKKDYAKIVQEAAAIQDAQKEAMQYFQGQLLTAVKVLERLQQQTGSETASTPEEMAEMEKLLSTLLVTEAPALPSTASEAKPDQHQAQS